MIHLASKLKTKISLLNVVEPPYHIYPVYDGAGYLVVQELYAYLTRANSGESYDRK